MPYCGASATRTLVALRRNAGISPGWAVVSTTTGPRAESQALEQADVGAAVPRFGRLVRIRQPCRDEPARSRR